MEFGGTFLRTTLQFRLVLYGQATAKRFPELHGAWRKTGIFSLTAMPILCKKAIQLIHVMSCINNKVFDIQHSTTIQLRGIAFQAKSYRQCLNNSLTGINFLRQLQQFYLTLIPTTRTIISGVSNNRVHLLCGSLKNLYYRKNTTIHTQH